MKFLLPRQRRAGSFQAEISKLVMRLVRLYDQDERETDGSVHCNSMSPKLRKAFQKSGGREFSVTGLASTHY